MMAKFEAKKKKEKKRESCGTLGHNRVILSFFMSFGRELVVFAYKTFHVGGRVKV